MFVWSFSSRVELWEKPAPPLSGGLRLRNYCAVAGNHKFSSRFSVFACFCGGYSNRVKGLRRLSGNFISVKASLFNKGLETCTFTIRSKHLEQSFCLWTAHLTSNLFVRWFILNKVIDTICSVHKILWSLWGEIRLLSQHIAKNLLRAV